MPDVQADADLLCEVNMLRDDLTKSSGVGIACIIVIQDTDLVWLRSGATSIAEEHGYSCVCSDDAIMLRYHYERQLADKQGKLLFDYTGSYIPYDIGRDA